MKLFSWRCYIVKEFSHEYAEQWFHNPTTLEKQGGIWPIKIGHNRAKPNYKMGPRTISFFSLHFVLDGEGTFIQNDSSIKLEKGDIFCLFPNLTHQYFTNPNNTLKMFWLAFDGKQAVTLLNRIGITNYSPYVKKCVTLELKALLDELMIHFKEDAEDNEIFGIITLYKLFDYLTAQAKKNNLAPTPPINWIQKSKEYMDMHYEDITIQDVAKYIGIHRSHFTPSFTNEVGVTPYKYLVSLKMKRAMELLESEEDHTVTEIALSLGYSDLFSFSRAFKNYYGVSPKQLLRDIGSGPASLD